MLADSAIQVIENTKKKFGIFGVIMIKALFKHIYKYYKDTFILAIAGVVIGVLVGIIDAAFWLGLMPVPLSGRNTSGI